MEETSRSLSKSGDLLKFILMFYWISNDADLDH